MASSCDSVMLAPCTFHVVPESVGCASWINGPGPTFLDCHIVFNFVELFNVFPVQYMCR